MKPPEQENFGYYEKRLCLLLCLSSIPNAFGTLYIVVSQYRPPHHCALEDIRSNLAQQLQDRGYNQSYLSEDALLNYTIPWKTNPFGEVERAQCVRYNISTASLDEITNSTEATVNATEVPCQAIQFFGNEVSAVSEFNLVCDDAWLVPVLSSQNFVGTMVGMLICGFFSDRFGRRKAFLLFTVWQFCATLLISFSSNVAMYGICIAIIGLGQLLNYLSAAVIGAEMLPKRYRAFSYSCVGGGFGIGYMITGYLVYIFPDWRWYMRFISLIGILYIPYYWLIDETPQWLVASGRIDEAEAILKKVEKINGKKTRSIKDIQATLAENEGTLGSLQTFRLLVKTPVLFVRFIVQILAWAIVGFGYFLVVWNVNSLSGSRYLNILYSGMMEVASVVMNYFLAHYAGRCKTYVVLMGSTAVSIVATAFLYLHSGTAVVALTMFTKLMIGAAFSVVYLHSPEIFPTKSRQTCVGFLSSAARLGGFVAPYIIYAGEDGNVIVPSLGTAAVIFLACALYLLLPETKNVEMPQTVLEAVAMESAGSQWFRCIKRKPSDQRSVPVSEPLVEGHSV